MVIQWFVCQVVLSVIDLQILLQNWNDLLQNGDLFLQIYHGKNLLNRLLAIKLPVAESEKEDHINVQSVDIESELSQ